MFGLQAFIKEYLIDAITEMNISLDELANKIEVSPDLLNNIINENIELTFEIAEKLSKFFGNSVDFWINLQTKYNEYIDNNRK